MTTTKTKVKSQEQKETKKFIFDPANDPATKFNKALLDAQQAQFELIEQYKKENSKAQDELKSQIEELSKKVVNRNPLAIDSIYMPYINRLIKETAKWYDMPPDEVTYSEVKSFRNMSKDSHELGRQAVRYRLLRLKYLRGIKKAHIEFEDELCSRLGMTKGQIRVEPQAVAIYFNEYHKSTTFEEALELNCEYMKVAKEVIFKLEEKYAIYDTDKEYSATLMSKFHNHEETVKKYSDSEYIEWFQLVTKEYARICKTTDNGAEKLMFEYINRIGREKMYFDAVVFGNNTLANIHKILNDNHLRIRFPGLLLYNFIGMW